MGKKMGNGFIGKGMDKRKKKELTRMEKKKDYTLVGLRMARLRKKRIIRKGKNMD